MPMTYENPQRQQLVLAIKKHIRKSKSRFWVAVLKSITKAKGRRVAVNLDRISRYGREDKIIVVPGKVLGSGKLDKKLRIAALVFSQAAKTKVEQTGGQCFTLTHLLDSQVQGKEMQILR